MSKSKRRNARVEPLTARDLRMRVHQVDIENPGWDPAKDGVGGVPRFDRQDKNVKSDAIETLFARKFLGPSQKAAADKFSSLYRAAGGSIASLDYSRDVVDGGRGDPVSTKMMAAMELRRCRELLGRRGYENVEAVCGEGKSLAEISAGKRDRLTAADNLRADLDDLGGMWGMQTKRRGAA